MQPAGRAELRREFAGPLAVAVVTEALGLRDVDVNTVLSWYAAIVAAVSEVTAGQAGHRGGRRCVRPAAGRRGAHSRQYRPAIAAKGRRASAGGLSQDEVASNAAVLMFGGIDTTEGMILNAVRHLLSDPETLALVRERRGFLAEHDRGVDPVGAGRRDRRPIRHPRCRVGGAQIQRGDLVSISIAGANRDPAVFSDPDRFDIRRANARLNLAFALGPHFCLGAQLARTETTIAVGRLLDRLPGLRLDSDYPNAPRGLVFRKPPTLQVRWTDRP